jgi:hypothetical protein
VASPGVHLAGQTSPGWLATYWAACTLRSSSLASRPMPRSWISQTLMTPFGVDDESAAQRQAFFLDHHVEVAGDRAGRVADHRVSDLLDGVGSIVPGLVREVGVGGHRVDSTPIFWKDAYSSARSPSSVGQTKVKSAG